MLSPRARSLSTSIYGLCGLFDRTRGRMLERSLSVKIAIATP
ncbi:MAG: hypothetical protein ACM65L_10960 [Microcoleus sp.]